MSDETGEANRGTHSRRRTVLRRVGGVVAGGLLAGCLSQPPGETRTGSASDSGATSLSEPPSIAWKRWYDSAAEDATPYPEPNVTLVSAVATPDGGYALAGHVQPPDAGYTPLVLKTDANGREEWRRLFGGGPRRARGLVATADGGFLLVGRFKHPDTTPTGGGGGTPGRDRGRGSRGGGAIKTDSRGQVQWWAFPRPDTRSSVWDAVETVDGRFALAGWIEENDEYAGWFVLLDSTGQTVRTRTFHSTPDEAERVNDYTVAELFTTVANGQDGGFVLAGKNAGGGRVLGLDATGSTGWTTQFDFPRDVAYDVLATPGGGFVLTGRLFDVAVSDRSAPAGGSRASGRDRPQPRHTSEMFPTSVYLTRLDSSGTEQWIRAAHAGGNAFGQTVLRTADGGYLIAGGSVGGPDDESTDVFVVKTDRNGRETWRRTYLEDTAGTVGHELVRSPDGGYALAAEDVFVKFEGDGSPDGDRGHVPSRTRVSRDAR